MYGEANPEAVHWSAEDWNGKERLKNRPVRSSVKADRRKPLFSFRAQQSLSILMEKLGMILLFGLFGFLVSISVIYLSA